MDTQTQTTTIARQAEATTARLRAANNENQHLETIAKSLPEIERLEKANKELTEKIARRFPADIAHDYKSTTEKLRVLKNEQLRLMKMAEELLRIEELEKKNRELTEKIGRHNPCSVEA